MTSAHTFSTDSVRADAPPSPLRAPLPAPSLAVPPARPRTSLPPAPPDARTWLGLFGVGALPAAEQAALTALAHNRVVPAGATVFDRCDRANALVLAQSGDVALGYRGADGVFRIERPVRGPAWLDQSSAWLGASHAMDARATSEAVVVDLPVDAVRAALTLHPNLARHLVVSLSREVQSLSMNTHALMHKDAPARFAAWLLQRLQSQRWQGSATSSHPPLVRLGERKRDIAAQLAITPETLSRLMRALTRQGVLSVSGYNVLVLDVPALERTAAGH
ncbi:MAG: Crp/Fnr family transcriptional regulator [Rubrivivax sp.]